MTEKVHHLRAASFNTRRNLPAGVGRKRGESNFLRAFERAYFARHLSGMAAGEFALVGFGVADLVWIAWKPQRDTEEFSALSLERQLARRRLFAFEAKIKDWQRALQQAFRYRYFADKAIVVMPAANATRALAHLDTFKEMQVGLWTFDSSKNVIREHFTPSRVKALNDSARQKAIKVLTSKFNLRKLGELSNAGI